MDKIQINHNTSSMLEAVGLTEENGKLFKEKVKNLSLKIAKDIENNGITTKRSELCETIQKTFLPIEMLLLATHSIEIMANEILKIKYELI